MTEYPTLTFTREIGAPVAEVRRAFTHPTLLRDWLCNAADTEPHPGGRLYLYWHGGEGPGYAVTGRYLALDADTLVWIWQGSGDPGETRVRVDCTPGGAGSILRLAHTGLGQGVEWQAQAERWPAEWAAALENLQSVLETGVDLRLARRPRLGILMDEFSADKAARLGSPVRAGVLLHGVLEGSGAQAAGLQANDILVSLNGVALEGQHSFQRALRGLKAGDRPVVEYYRGTEQRSTPLALGSFPIAPLPESAGALAAEYRATCAEILRTMRAQTAGLDDDQAIRRPRDEEWSLRELVAHFVLMERDYQSWMADMLNDTPVQDDLEMRPNANPRIRALVARLPRLCAQDGQPGLLDELALAMEETAALLAGLPESFTQNRKHLYRRVADWAREVTPSHFSEEHGEQFQQLLEGSGRDRHAK